MSSDIFIIDKNPLEIFHAILFENGTTTIFKEYLNNPKLISQGYEYLSEYDYYIKEEIHESNKKVSFTTDIINRNKYLEICLKNHVVEIIRLLPITLTGYLEREKELYISDILQKLEIYKQKIKFSNFDTNDYSVTIENEIDIITDFINNYFSEIVEDIRLKNNTEKYFKLGTNESPFKFYEDLIFNEEYSKFSDAFYIETIYTKGYKLVLERTKEVWFEAWLNKLDITDMIHYEHYLKKVLKYNSKDAFEKLAVSLSKFNDDKAILFLKQQLNILYSLIRKLDEKENYQELKEELLLIVSDIDIRYSSFQITHKVFKKITNEIESIYSIFQLKDGIKRSFFEKLYDATITLDLIDDVVIREELFIEVFTSPKPDPSSKIQFTKPNSTVALYLKEIEPFFDNFNSTSIEKSKNFLNKQGKIITSTDLYTAISRNKDKTNNDLIKIQKQISLLKKEYLK